MQQITIFGGNRLQGSLEIETAKNAILPMIAGCLLTSAPVVLCKVPCISDVQNMFEILRRMGCVVQPDGDKVCIDTSNICQHEIPRELAQAIRSSIFMLGPLLARQKKATVVFPGGCDIGARPIDLHLSGLRDLQVEICEQHGYIYCNGERMKAGVVHLDYPSVGATENIMMAAVLLKGRTTIINCAKEPEIVDLAKFINSMGGKIKGAGTDTITIDGVSKLHGTTYTPMPDRIVCGTYAIASAMTQGDVTLTNARPQDISALLTKLRYSGCQVKCKRDTISVQAPKRLRSVLNVETQPYPGFPTDLQAPFLAMQAISNGISVITENVFETRFKHVSELVRMGAKITVKNRTAIVQGVPSLYGAEVMAQDLRGGAALVLAGLTAHGTTTIKNAQYLDRGYERMEQKLALLGANISRQS